MARLGFGAKVREVPTEQGFVRYCEALGIEVSGMTSIVEGGTYRGLRTDFRLYYIKRQPWQSVVPLAEPDRVEWVDAETGYECQIIRRLPSGHLAGYVGVPASHPLFELKLTSDIGWPALTIHRAVGRTVEQGYSGAAGSDLPYLRDGEGGGLRWWFGVEANGKCDLMPSLIGANEGARQRYEETGEITPYLNVEYRDVEAVAIYLTTIAGYLKATPGSGPTPEAPPIDTNRPLSLFPEFEIKEQADAHVFRHAGRPRTTDGREAVCPGGSDDDADRLRRAGERYRRRRDERRATR